MASPSAVDPEQVGHNLRMYTSGDVEAATQQASQTTSSQSFDMPMTLYGGGIGVAVNLEEIPATRAMESTRAMFRTASEGPLPLVYSHGRPDEPRKRWSTTSSTKTINWK